MKKFMKAIAFVTVMCMALSTVAFAETGAALDETVPKQVNVTVEGAGNGEQVALYIVAEGGDTDDTPLYIDQKAANASGVASFVAPIANETVKKVEVFVGYATYANETPTLGALHVDTVALEKAITKVTVVKVAADAVQGGETEDLKAQEQTGAGVWGEFSVEAPAGVEASKMIWAIRYADKVKYSDSIDVADYHIGNMVTGSIKLGFAFLNGSELNNIDPVTITEVDAIFLFVDTDGTDFEDQEVLTNDADEGNKKPTAVAE